LIDPSNPMLRHAAMAAGIDYDNAAKNLKEAARQVAVSHALLQELVGEEVHNAVHPAEARGASPEQQQLITAGCRGECIYLMAQYLHLKRFKDKDRTDLVTKYAKT